MFEKETTIIVDGVEIVSQGFDYGFMAFVLISCIASLCLYLLPSFIAIMRHHNDKLVICIVNVFFGWSVIGWVFALGWSLIKR